MCQIDFYLDGPNSIPDQGNLSIRATELAVIVSCRYYFIQRQSCITLTKNLYIQGLYSLREKCRYSELFWSVFYRIWTECEEILRISPYSVRMQENVDQNNSKYGYCLRSDFCVYIWEVTVILDKFLSCPFWF